MREPELGPTSSAWLRARSLAASALGYSAAFALLTLPLATRPSSHVISHWDVDIEHSLWAQWWFATALTSGEHALFETDMIDFPQVVDLRLADLNLAVVALGSALEVLLAPAAAYNASLLLAFVSSGLLLRQLALRLGASASAAWLAGLVFAGSPAWIACMSNGWGSLVHVWVLPLCLVAGLRVRDRPGAATGALLGAAFALGFHTTPYYAIYAVVLAALLLPWQIRAIRAWLALAGALPALFAAALVASLLVAPRAIGMAAAAAAPQVVHHGPLDTALSAPLLEWIWPARRAVAARVSEVGYLVVFPGYTLLATLALALARGGARRLAMWLATAAALALLSLGPALVLADGVPTPLPLPGALLQRLPGFELTTNHWRYALPAALCLAVAFALGLSALQRELEARRPGCARALPAALAALLAIELVLLWPFPLAKPLWEVRASPIAARLAARDDVHAVFDRTALAKLNQTVHGKPIALGWLPRLAVEVQRANRAMVRVCDQEPPECALRFGIDAVVLDERTALLLRDGGRSELLRALID